MTRPRRLSLRRPGRRELAGWAGLAERGNLADLETVAGGPLAGLLAEGSGSLPREAFRAAARRGLGRSLGGSRGARVR